jgi:zinc D-Ala-D-Ala dipeptidase
MAVEQAREWAGARRRAIFAMMPGRFRPLLCALALTLAAACAATSPTPSRPDGFVDAGEQVPGLVLDIRYAGSNNFVGRPIAGYEAPRCLLTREAAAALAAVQADLNALGYGLKVFDCYRPARAVADFAAWARDLDDQRMRAEYYPNVDKSRLFELGYIAERSGHSRGSTLDVTIVEVASGEELDMGTPFDLFDPRSWPSDESVSAEARRHRMMLQSAMAARGFRPLREEWWHFTLEGEPYPETYFDFPVR